MNRPGPAPGYVIERDRCRAAGDGQWQLCLDRIGHDGAHWFRHCEGALMRLPDGSLVRFGGVAR